VVRTDQPFLYVTLFAFGLALGHAPCSAGAEQTGASRPTTAEAQELEPEELVIRTTERLISTVKAQHDVLRDEPMRAVELLEEIVAPHVDFESVSRQVLRRHWRQASEDQRRRFTEEFRQLLLRTYAAAVPEYVDQTLTYQSIRTTRGDGRATVYTRIARKGEPPIGLDYRLHRVDGAWRIVDVVVEGVSLVQTYRSAFAEELKRSALDGLIERLAVKNNRDNDG